MPQFIRRVNVRAVSKNRMRVDLSATIAVEPGVLMRSEADEMRKVLADKLMLFMANEVPYLSVYLSDVKVTR
jgi:hypothetical protein